MTEEMPASTSLKILVPGLVPAFYKTLDVISENVEKCLLFSLHFALSCLQYLTAILQTLVSYRLKLPFRSITLSAILNDAKKLPKFPKHLAVIIDEDNIYLKEVADIIVWSVVVGIPCITISDSKGYLLKNSSTLQEHVKAKYQGVCGDSYMCYYNAYFHIGSYNENSTAPVNVIISSTKSGRESLIKCAQTLAVQMAENEELNRKCTATIVDSKHREFNCVANDPDFLISFGPYLSYFGFQPWNMRLTEMISLPNHRSFNYDKYIKSLMIFAGCQQRFGT